LRKEVRADGIRVTSVFTGLVDTDFHTSPQGSEEHKDWLKAEDVSEAIVYAISRREGVVVDELLIHPTSQDW
jgi:NADP-dependent 3-hydroxy acid dehydrogenase YdfG